MINPYIATIVLVVFIITAGALLPVLNAKFKDFVSYRWTVIVVVCALLIGATIDFAGLDDGSRHIILIAGFVIAGCYVLLRTLEKMAANNWSILGSRKVEASIQKGDIQAKLELSGEEKESKDE